MVVVVVVVVVVIYLVVEHIYTGWAGYNIRPGTQWKNKLKIRKYEGKCIMSLYIR